MVWIGPPALALALFVRSGSAIVVGVVESAGGQPIEDATVRLTCPCTVEREAQTDLEGVYMFTALPPGVYEVFVGYGPDRRRGALHLVEDDVARLDFTLAAEPDLLARAGPVPATESRCCVGSPSGAAWLWLLVLGLRSWPRARMNQA